MSGGRTEKNPPPADEAQQIVDVAKAVELHKTLRAYGKYVAWVAGAFFAYKAIDALAGRATSVEISTVLKLFADFRIVLTISLAGAASAWAVIERKVRQNTTQRLHARIKELETAFDQKRSSSRLTSKGRTNPKDKSNERD